MRISKLRKEFYIDIRYICLFKCSRCSSPSLFSSQDQLSAAFKPSHPKKANPKPPESCEVQVWRRRFSPRRARGAIGWASSPWIRRRCPKGRWRPWRQRSSFWSTLGWWLAGEMWKKLKARPQILVISSINHPILGVQHCDLYLDGSRRPKMQGLEMFCKGLRWSARDACLMSCRIWNRQETLVK